MFVTTGYIVYIGPEYFSRGEVYYHGGCENAKVPWKIVLPRNGDVFYLYEDAPVADLHYVQNCQFLSKKFDVFYILIK